MKNLIGTILVLFRLATLTVVCDARSKNPTTLWPSAYPTAAPIPVKTKTTRKHTDAPVVMTTNGPTSLPPIPVKAKTARKHTDAPVVMSTQLSTTLSPTTAKPTSAPTQGPTPKPTTPPTNKPSLFPTESPISPPTEIPTSPPTETPTSDPTTVPTIAPTMAPTVEPSYAPTDSPSDRPTDLPTPIPTLAPTVFVLSPVPPIDLKSSSNGALVQSRCLEILASVTMSPKSLAAYWAPHSKTPLYFSAPEGAVNATLKGFTPDFYYLSDAVSNRFTTAQNLTSVDVVGTTCSMNLELTLEGGTSVAVSRSFMELDDGGFLVKWMNAFSLGDEEAMPSEQATGMACTAAFQTLFPPLTGLSMASMMSAVNLFVPKTATFAFPLGNPNTTLTNITSGWSIFTLFLAHLNPFDMPTFALMTSAVDVTGSVCSFDQDLYVTFKANPNCTTPLVVPGRVIMEMAPPVPTAGLAGGMALGGQVVRLLSLFDNSTMWGGIEICVADKKLMEEAARAQKAKAALDAKNAKILAQTKAAEAKKAAQATQAAKKKQAKADKAAKKKQAKADKAAKKKAAKDKKSASKSSRGKKKTSATMWIGGDFVEDLLGNHSGMPIMTFFIITLVASLVVSVLSTTRARARRYSGYQEIVDVEDSSLVV
jgi:hypothetical protein